MDNGGRGEGVKVHQGTCIKDSWTKPKEGRIEGGWWGLVGQGCVVMGKMETTVLEQEYNKTKLIYLLKKV